MSAGTKIQLTFSLTHGSLVTAENAHRIVARFTHCTPGEPGSRWRISGKPGHWSWGTEDGSAMPFTMEPKGTVKGLVVDFLRQFGGDSEVIVEDSSHEQSAG